MGESRASAGKGILKAEFQTPVSPWVKLHREIFWQNTKGTEMKAEPRIYIANGICPGGTASVRGGAALWGTKPAFPELAGAEQAQGGSPGLRCCGELITAPQTPPASPGTLRVLIRAGQTTQKWSGGAHVSLGCRRICWSPAGWAMTQCQGI